MATTTLPQGEGPHWKVLDILTEVLAIPFALLLSPFEALGRAIGQAGSRRKVADFADEVRITQQRMRLESKRALHFLKDNLEAMKELDRQYLKGSYRTPEQARRACELLQLARHMQLNNARALASAITEEKGSHPAREESIAAQAQMFEPIALTMPAATGEHFRPIETKTQVPQHKSFVPFGSRPRQMETSISGPKTKQSVTKRDWMIRVIRPALPSRADDVRGDGMMGGA